MCQHPIPHVLKAAVEYARSLAKGSIEGMTTISRVATIPAGTSVEVTIELSHPAVAYAMLIGAAQTAPDVRALLGVRARRDSGRYIVGDQVQPADVAGFSGSDATGGTGTPVSPTVIAGNQKFTVTVTNDGAAAATVRVSVWFLEMFTPGEAF